MRFSLLALALLCVLPLYTQTRTFRIQDSQTGESVPFATIVTGPDKGTISNEEGYFTIDPGALQGSLQVSCMGYRSLSITAEQLPQDRAILTLDPAAIHLNEVRVGERIPTAAEIVRNARERLEENYSLAQSDFSVYYRESETMRFERLDLELEKASDLRKKELESADARLQQLGRDIVKSNATRYLDLSGKVRLAADTLNRFRVDRATELVDHNKDFSMERIQERAQQIVLDHLDTTQTYKLKTGMFKIEDSIAVGDEFFDSDPADKDSSSLNHLQNMNRGLLQLASWKDTHLPRLLDAEWYRHSFLGPSYFDGNYVYAIGFSPNKRKADFSGTLYVDALSWAVLKIDYAYAPGREGEKVNFKWLLGVKFIEDRDRGTLIFRKGVHQKYYPYFIQKEYGNYIYLHRNLKFIENSAAKKKVQFDFLLEGGAQQVQTVLIRPVDPGAPDPFEGYNPPKKIFVRKLDRFEPTIWQDAEVIAPLEDMRKFRVERP